jgi:hypothetical protein
MTDELNAWIKSGEYLPDLMRDFHDQKELFKTLHQTVNVKGHKYAGDVSWVVGHCYTVDIFLWWMAQHGYVLRRASKKRGYRDLETSLSTARQARSHQLLSALKGGAE